MNNVEDEFDKFFEIYSKDKEKLSISEINFAHLKLKEVEEIKLKGKSDKSKFFFYRELNKN